MFKSKNDFWSWLSAISAALTVFCIMNGLKGGAMFAAFSTVLAFSIFISGEIAGKK